MKILYDDSNMVVFVKEPGTDSEKITCRELYGGGTEGKLYCVHRLDRETGGVTVFAKNETAAAALSRGFRDRTVRKSYLALCEGQLTPECGEMEDLLFHDRAENKTFVVSRERRGTKKAALSYRVLGSRPAEACRADRGNGELPAFLSLVQVELHTGRTHQIRAQFASRKHPLAGDRRYGSRIRIGFGGICLWSRELKIPDPDTGEIRTFTSEPHWGQ